MSASYFNNFNTIPYRIDDSGNVKKLTNITTNVKAQQFIENTGIGYMKYRISDGERPDIVSQQLYGTPNYYWTFFIVNTHLRDGAIGAWPLSNAACSDVISRKYDSYAVLTLDPLTKYRIDISNGITYGNTSYIPFDEKFYPILYLKPVTNQNQIMHDARVRIISYDYEMSQLIVSRNVQGNQDISIDEFINDYSSYSIVAENSTSETNIRENELIDEYKKTVALAYEETDIERPQRFIYEVALDKFDNCITKNNKLAWPLMRNAAFVYYETDDVTGNPLTISGFDIVTKGRDYSLPFLNDLEFKPQAVTIDDEFIIINDQVVAINGLEPDSSQYWQPARQRNFCQIINSNSVQILTSKPVYTPVRYCDRVFANLKIITYAEKEIIENDKLEFINVIGPSNIKRFATEYFKVLRA